MPADLYGPFGLLIALSAAVGWLAREYRSSVKERIADLVTQRDAAIAGWRDQTTATNRLADAIEVAERDRAKRTRQGDR